MERRVRELRELCLQVLLPTNFMFVQSWTPSAAGTSFSVASIRRPYTARGFTYAEKIELMKQQNDYDAEFLNKHIRKTSK